MTKWNVVPPCISIAGRGVVGEHEHRVVVHGIVAPPSVPVVAPRPAPPRPAHRTEHVAAHDRGADAGEPRGDRGVVDAGRTAGLSHHLATGAGLEDPLVQPGPPDAERVLEVLVGTGDVAVEGHGHGMDP